MTRPAGSGTGYGRLCRRTEAMTAWLPSPRREWSHRRLSACSGRSTPGCRGAGHRRADRRWAVDAERPRVPRSGYPAPWTLIGVGARSLVSRRAGDEVAVLVEADVRPRLGRSRCGHFEYMKDRAGPGRQRLSLYRPPKSDPSFLGSLDVVAVLRPDAQQRKRNARRDSAQRRPGGVSTSRANASGPATPPVLLTAHRGSTAEQGSAPSCATAPHPVGPLDTRGGTARTSWARRCARWLAETIAVGHRDRGRITDVDGHRPPTPAPTAGCRRFVPRLLTSEQHAGHYQALHGDAMPTGSRKSWL